jgi:hypothetical protein
MREVLGADRLSTLVSGHSGSTARALIAPEGRFPGPTVRRAGPHDVQEPALLRSEGSHLSPMLDGSEAPVVRRFHPEEIRKIAAWLRLTRAL